MNGQGRRDPDRFSSIFPEDILSKPLGSLSMGQRKKVALAGALSGSPSVLLLDEPTNGLDPLAIRDLRRTLLAQRARGILILISSHHLDELQRIADALVFVQDGSVLGAWSREEALGAFSSLEDLFDHHFGDGRND
jgi:ABC-type multidrug transport system ATPase subunit